MKTKTAKQIALDKGLPFYRRDEPCKNGHMSEYATLRGECQTCRRDRAKKWDSQHPEQANNRRRKYDKLNPRVTLNSNYGHKRALIDQCPKWLNDEDKQKILKIYESCRSLTRSSKIKHNVDHIVPLRGKLVCGLHVPWNLQILTAEANRKKSNL